MLSRRHLLAAGLGAPFVSASVRAGEGVAEQPWNLDGLAGTLCLPRGRASGLGVLIISGSGPTDRDGNGPGLASNLYRQLAQGLATAGHVVLRYDKRGVGESRGLAAREEDITFPLLVEDARRALLALKERADVLRVVPLGHSEGGLIAMSLAATVDVAGLVLMATPGRPLGVILQEQLVAMGAPPELLAASAAILEALVRGVAVAEVSPVLAPLYRPSVQPYLMSQIGIDPVRELAQVSVPTLILSAGRDLQVSGADAARLAAAEPGARLVRLVEANHLFKAAPEDRAGNVALYADPNAPLHPGVMPTLLDFLASLT